MWFSILSFIIATALMVKAAVALAIPQRFYATRQRQYASDSLPPELMIPPAVIFTMTLAAWYATVAHYRPWGWVVTLALTLLAGGSLNNLLRWRRHRAFMAKTVATPKVWIIDCVLLVAGAGFFALAIRVY